MGILDNCEPKAVFKYFEEIANIPHGSRDTDKISDYLVDFAKERNLKYIQDKLGNVIIFKTGTNGYENSAPVIIQGHMDMVCEKANDCDLDFHTDGLRLKTDGEKVWAEGTTLGGDDGIAVAMALAILDAPEGSIEHPPIEAVFTVDEEIGMLGASFIDCSVLKGKTMLNLDSEDEGVLLVSCAGGATAACHLELDTEKLSIASNGAVKRIQISGGTGGHSGVEIIKQRANASKEIARVIKDILALDNVKLLSINGGSKDNAIPREAYADLYIENDNAMSKLGDKIKTWDLIIKNEFKSTDDEIKLQMLECDKVYYQSISKSSALKAINTIIAMPNGIRRMSDDIEGMVQTSLNLGIMCTSELSDNKLELILSFCVRSSVKTEKEALISELNSIMELAGGTLTISGDYPAWEYKKESKLRELMIECFERLYGKTPVVETLHAGVECGLFAGKIDELDCVSYGPNMLGIHTTAETIYVDSVKRTYEYTLDILKNLK